jgi:hypothetical protein
MAEDMMQLASLARPPHEVFGYQVREPLRYLTRYQATKLDLACLHGSRRLRADRLERAAASDKGGGVNTVITGIQQLLGI